MNVDDPAKPIMMHGVTTIVTEVEKSLAALNPGPEAAGLVAMCRLYAVAIADSGGSQNSLKEMGPKLVTALAAIGAAKARAPELPAVGEPDAPADPLVQARGAETELDKMRRRRAQRGQPA